MHQNFGYMTLITAVYAAIFLVIVSALAGYILVQKTSQTAKEAREEAVQIAEAGLDYYKWHLAHFPNDIQDGTGQSGPYVHQYADPEIGAIGEFSLEIDGNPKCGVNTAIDITSTGVSDDSPTFTRKVFGRYSRPSVAEYSYILNSNVWAGADRVITGKYHSNGGIRMDGTNNSTVSSAVSTWSCTSSFGCSPTQNQNGVFGAGPNSNFWTYPVPQIDFAGITVDLAAMKDYAQNNGGLHFGPVGGESGRRGYHLVFQSDGTVTIYRVTNTTAVWGYSDSGGWLQERHIISNETLLGNYTIPTACSLIYLEDKAWIEGTVKGKVTVASADTSQPNYDTDIVIVNNLNYSTTDGSDGLTAVAEKSVIIPLNSPTTLNVRGIFIAQLGYFGRNHYTTSGEHEVPSSYDSYVQQDTMTITGTVVSNGRVGTKWTCGGVYCSGYNQRTDAYDRDLATDPPPFTPYTSTDYRFLEWREEDQ